MALVTTSCVNSPPTKRTSQSAPASAQDQPDPNKPIWVECKQDAGYLSEEIKLDIPKERFYLEDGFLGPDGHSQSIVSYEGDIVLSPDQIYLEYLWHIGDKFSLGTAFAIDRKTLKFKETSFSLRGNGSERVNTGTVTGKCEIMKTPPKTDPPATVNQI